MWAVALDVQGVKVFWNKATYRNILQRSMNVRRVEES